jgi:cold-inducible RNA-binding protein
MNIFVGNLPFSTTDANLEESFSAHGDVASAKVIIDRMTGRSRGFGFVEMADSAQGQTAIEALNGLELDGRAMTVNEARART